MIINRIITAYRVEESWVIKGEPGFQTTLLPDEEQAKQKLNDLIQTESSEGCILDWSKDPRFEVESAQLFYECWIRDEYCENRYKISIVQEQIPMSEELFESIGRAYVDDILRKHFADQTEDWEELEDLSEEQIAEMIAEPDVPERIKKQLKENGYLIESYWESVSEASFALVKDYHKKHIDSK